MNRILFCGFVVIVLIWTPSAFCQEAKPSVKLLAKVKDKAILLRWAPTDHVTWNIANRNGYVIERFTILKGQEVQSKPARVQLNTSPIKPLPLEQWRVDAEKNDFSAVAAEAIFGESFEVTTPNSQDLLQMINKSKEQEQRYSFALLAADYSFQTAMLSGLAFKDSTVKQDEKYLYRIYIAVNDPKTKIDTALYYISPRDTVKTAPPSDLEAVFGDKAVLFRLPKNGINESYSGFILEKASDPDKTFRKVNTTAIVGVTNSDDQYYYQSDSLQQNGLRYYYRMRGLTPFGDLSEPSEEISGEGFGQLKAKAHIKKGAETEGGKIQLEWEISGDITTAIGFHVERSNQVSGVFKKVNSSMLPVQSTTFTDATPESTNYYRIVVMGGNEQSIPSLPYLVQLVDSIPPSAPQQIRASVDTMGVVKIEWAPNKESDLLGYRMFRSNFEKSEYSQITVSPIAENIFYDTINLKTLTRKMYYKVSAVDRRFNTSSYSVPINIIKPDKIAPTPPVFKTVRSTTNGVELSWIGSSSEDVVSYLLYRKAKVSPEWAQLKKFTRDTLQYVDRIQDAKTEYQYMLVAIDEVGNKSVGGKTVSGRKIDDGSRPEIKNIKHQIDRKEKSIKVTWTYTADGVDKYAIYRATEESSPTLYKTVKGDSQGIKDENLSINTVYRYRIKAIFKDGAESPFSEEVRIKF